MWTLRRIIFAILVSAVSGIWTFAADTSPTADAFLVEKLPPGYVRGEVVSYSYVPNRRWGRAESIGILPYLFEYALLTMKDGTPLEQYHTENVRRIDMVSQWSTAVMLYPRHDEYHDEIIRLMIRCFRRRQLIVLSDSVDHDQPDNPNNYRKLTHILDTLWASRDKDLTNPEGDRATGRQLINNLLAVNIGDEGFSKLKTQGMETAYREFDRKIKNRLLNGERPFAHIKPWYNDLHGGFGAYAIDEKDAAAGRSKLPANTDIFGVDVYHWWGFDHIPFDPDDPKVTPDQLLQQVIGWQNVITKYYGPGFRAERGDGWDPKYKNDTHLLLQGLDYAGADRAQMWFIANSDTIEGRTYTTPIETMDAFYDSLKAGPWTGLCWWNFNGYQEGGRRGAGAHFPGTLRYIDKELKHYTPEHPEGVDYTEEQLENYRRRFIESRMRMFNDVVYRQFAHLNEKMPKDKQP